MILLFPDNSGCLLPGESKMFHLTIVQVCMLSCIRLLVTPGLWPARLLCPWNFSGKNTGVGCHFLLQGIFPSQGTNPGLPHCRWILYQLNHKGSPAGSDGKASACNAGDLGSISGLGRSPGEGNGNPLQHSCLENPTDGGA